MIKLSRRWRVDSIKIAGYLNLARKSNNLIIGTENLKKYNKKLYLIILSKTAGKTACAVAQKQKERTECEVVVADIDLAEILNINNCQIVALKNKGFADMVIQNLD